MQSTLKIAVCGSASQSLVKVRRPIIQALHRAGHRVLACAPNIPAHRREALNSWGIETASISMRRQGINPLADLRTIYSLYNLFRTWNPDKVLVYNAKPVVYGSLAAWASGAEPYVIVTGLGRNYTVNTPRARFVRGILNSLYRISFSVCEGIFFQNEDDPELLSRHGALPRNVPKHITNGSGVDTEHFAPSPVPEKPTYLCLARLIAEKGIREYVAAARRVKERYPDATFQLAGHFEPDVPGAITEDELQQWTEEGVIEYLGYVDDVRSAIAQASTYVLPTYYREGTPRSILEAMSMGRPIITTDAPGCRGTVESGENGWLVAPKQVDELKEAMCWMIENNEQRRVMGQKSRQLAEEKYDVNVVNQTIMEGMGLI